MHLFGETEIEAGRGRVWETISNPNRAAASNSSGLAQVEKIDDRHYQVAVTAPSAMMPISVVVDLRLIDVEEPSRLAATIEGQIMGGSINGTGSIDLAELGPKMTRASWVADITLGGMLGGFEPMIRGPVQQAAEQGIASLKARLEAEEEAAAGA
ncbi:MAG: SRPBCC family protein [Candidatus Limnocylindrales bacterium]|jgi:carbon monoxide dehydrogenase subunit G